MKTLNLRAEYNKFLMCIEKIDKLLREIRDIELPTDLYKTILKETSSFEIFLVEVLKINFQKFLFTSF
jgi:hypothetical protein